MIAWRICKDRHADAAFTGEGAALSPGRWNRRGVPVVYASESKSLAILELLVHLHRSELPPSYVSFRVVIPDGVRTSELVESDLPDGWHTYPAPESLQAMGTRWVLDGAAVALVVPSAVTREERNILLNPRHADFPKLTIAPPRPLELDQRLL